MTYFFSCPHASSLVDKFCPFQVVQRLQCTSSATKTGQTGSQPCLSTKTKGSAIANVFLSATLKKSPHSMKYVETTHSLVMAKLQAVDCAIVKKEPVVDEILFR